MKSIINYFNTSIWTIISFLLVIVLILIPLASFLSYSFFTVEGVEIIHQFSLINYKEFFIDEIYINTFVRTIFLALFVMLCCILLGYPVAYFLARYAGKYKYAILLILIIPLFMSYIIKIYMMRSILGYSGLINKILKMLGIIEKPLEFFFMEPKFSNYYSRNKKIWIFGGSTSTSYCDDSSWPDEIQKYLPDYKIINFSTYGGTTDFSINTLFKNKNKDLPEKNILG